MNPGNLAVAVTFGIAFIVVLVILALAIPRPTPHQQVVFRIVLSLAAAGVAASIPGLMGLNFNALQMTAIQAGGALAVFVIVYFFNPAGAEAIGLTNVERGIMVLHRDLINGQIPHQDPNYLPKALGVPRAIMQALYDKLCS